MDDRHIADFVAERVFKGRSVIELKARNDDGDYDPDQEERVLERYRKNFGMFALPEELGEIYGMAALMATRGVRDGNAEYMADAIRRLGERQEKEKAATAVPVSP